MKKSVYDALTVDEETLQIVRKFFTQDKEGDVKARTSAKKALGNHLIRTNDGSFTFRSRSLNGKSENMHTSHGALTEALEKFVKPARFEGKEKVRVLDICSGLGYNAASCIHFLDDDVEIELDLIEISKETMALALLMDTPLESYDKPLKSYNIICKAVEDKLYAEGDIKFRHYKEEVPPRIKINLHLDDAREVVKELDGEKTYDAIFLDPFSPLKSPELYSIEFFNMLKTLLRDDGIILTYTSAAPVRAAMVFNGLYVGEGPSLGRSGGTIASLNADMIQKQLSMEDERMIALSDAGISFKDPDLNGSSHSILQRRNWEREALRGNDKFPSTVKTPIYLNTPLKEGRLKRRVLKNVKRLGFKNLTSLKSRYLVCPQYKDCICGSGCGYYNNSTKRINEMSHRLRVVLNTIETKDN